MTGGGVGGHRDGALSSKTTAVLPMVGSQLPPVSLLVCLLMWCVSVNGSSFLNQCAFQVQLFGGGSDKEQTKGGHLRTEK